MFWQDIPINSLRINILLDNENVTLAELLNEDDILQECKTLNKQLVEFLVRPSSIQELIRLIVEEPPPCGDLRLRYRNSAIASEIIASRVPTLCKIIAEDPQILGKLYSFLDNKPPLNPLLASFFDKTLEVLFTHSTAHQDWYTYQVMCLQVIEYFKSCSDFLPKFLEHIGTSGIMNSLQYITQVPVDDMRNNILSWLDSQDLIEKLIALICGTYTTLYVKNTEVDTKVIEEGILKLDLENSNQPPETTVDPEPNEINENVAADEAKVESSSAEVPNGPAESVEEKPLLTIDPEKLEERLLSSRSANATRLICNFISKGRESSDQGHKYVNPLLVKCLSADTINLLLEAMLSSPERNRKNAICNGIQVLLTLLNEEGCQFQPPVVKQEEIHRIAEIITPWLPQFVNILRDPPAQANGSSAVGVCRLAVARLLVALVDTDSPAVAAALVGQAVFPLLLDMFFQFQWNNFLHAYVEDMLSKALNAPSQNALYRKHLFTDCTLIRRIYTAWDENVLPDKARPGYMGHMIQIANHIQAVISQEPKPNPDPLPDLDLWEKLLDRLNEINQLYSTCLGGHNPADNSMQGPTFQPSQQECYNMEYINHDINFNDGDDLTADTVNDLTNNSEEIFSSICDNSSSSMGGGGVQGYSGNLGGLLELEEEISDEELLRKYHVYDNIRSIYHDFNPTAAPASIEWLKDCVDIWIDDNGGDPIAAPVPSIADANSSPWGDIGNLTNDQSGWADFGNLQETAGISNVPNTFTCEAFAAFDQENVPSNVNKTGNEAEVPLDGQPENKTVIIKVQLESDEPSPQESAKEEVCTANDQNAIKIEQIQSETSNDATISVSGVMPSFADIVRQQPGAQKVVVKEESAETMESCEAADKEGPASVPQSTEVSPPATPATPAAPVSDSSTCDHTPGSQR